MIQHVYVVFLMLPVVPEIAVPYPCNLAEYRYETNIMKLTSHMNISTFARWAPRVALLGIVIGALSIITIILPGPLYRSGVYGFSSAFWMVKGGAYGGILAIIIAIIGLTLVLLGRQPRYFSSAISGIVLGILALGIPYMWISKVESLPAIHDISTDTVNPPHFQPDILALRKGSENSVVYTGEEVAAQQTTIYPDIQPLLFNLPSPTVYAATLRAVQTLDWKLDSNDPIGGIIEATSTSLWFGTKYDVVIRIQALAHSTRLDIRSESRMGKRDAGKNAQLIRTFRGALYKQLGLQAIK